MRINYTQEELTRFMLNLMKHIEFTGEIPKITFFNNYVYETENTLLFERDAWLKKEIENFNEFAQKTMKQPTSIYGETDN